MYVGKQFISLVWLPLAKTPADGLQTLPKAPTELVAELSRRYITLFERITGQQFQPAANGKDIHARIAHNIDAALKEL